MDRVGTGLGVPGAGTQSSERLSNHGVLLLLLLLLSPIFIVYFLALFIHNIGIVSVFQGVVNEAQLLQEPPNQTETRN